ncbi:CIC_collapsed_G0027350.mRNA.1.CDS.1 [Saccharomyces cerevisiae]|nr:CIC_collapsed_G0027350.mRNA.1.CDS.1 [Saccharomyces cerevisiae]
MSSKTHWPEFCLMLPSSSLTNRRPKPFATPSTFDCANTDLEAIAQRIVKDSPVERLSSSPTVSNQQWSCPPRVPAHTQSNLWTLLKIVDTNGAGDAFRWWLYGWVD